jgi:RNA polymerase sigma-54 factor
VEITSVDVDWDSASEPISGYSEPSDSDFEPYETARASEDNLQEHLLWQLRLSSLGPVDRLIALSIVDGIDEDGYLRESVESIQASLEADCHAGLDEVLAVLHLVQRFDPPGVGARDLRECLFLQLEQIPVGTPGLDTARVIVRDHLNLLGQRDFDRLARLLAVPAGELQQAAALIQTLNPHPGARIGSEGTEAILPDVLVMRTAGAWRVELNPEIVPRLRINPYYAALIKRSDHSADNTYLRSQLQEARWFIKSLKSRNETLLKVASAIVERQCAFLDQGEEEMRPLVLKDIAEALSMHESTISRVTTNKYMMTPRGVYEFKYFFSSHVSTADGGACSATAIRAMLKKLIGEEDATQPLSDAALASILRDKGINVARRTVAKYREALSIPPSSERKRLS